MSGIDKHIIGDFAMEAIDSMASFYDGDEDVVIDSMVMVVAFRKPGSKHTDVATYCNDERHHVQSGLLYDALNG